MYFWLDLKENHCKRMWDFFFVMFLLFFASIHSEVREVKEIQAWTEKGEAIAPPTSYLREKEGRWKERERGRESLPWWCWRSDDMSST